jgi:hypothetical protein
MMSVLTFVEEAGPCVSSESGANRSLIDQPGSAFTAFAFHLKSGLARFHDEYHSFLDGSADLDGPVVADPVNDLVQRIAVNRAIVGRVDRILSPEARARAFGSASHPADSQAARDLADSVVTVFSTMLQWGREARGSVVETSWRPIYDVLSNLAREPLHQITRFADDMTAKAQAVKAELEAGRPPSKAPNVTLELTIGPGDMAALSNVLAASEVVPHHEVKKSRFSRK